MQAHTLFILVSFFLGRSNFIQAQRVVFNNNSYINLDGGAHLVLSNSNSNAITLKGAGGNIISESEDNVVDWKIGNNIGEYIVPFTTQNGVKIPTILNLSSGGVGMGEVLFSTHTDNDNINSWNNMDYLPSGVLNMFGVNGFTNNSAYVIDRFWTIEAKGYSTQPVGMLSFSYDNAERLAVGNTINSGTLKAQYYNPSLNIWEYPSSGIDAFPITNVTGVPTTTSFYKTWTLSEENNPLPVELLDFTVVEKNKKYVLLNWRTLSELNNDYFSVQKSKDGVHWYEVGQVNGMGTSVQMSNYLFKDYKPYIGKSYYRLEQFDFNGNSEFSTIKVIDFIGAEFMALYPNPYSSSLGALNLKVNTYSSGFVTIKIYDSKGGCMYKQKYFLFEGENLIVLNLEGIAKGNYVVSIQNQEGIYHHEGLIIN